MIEKFRLTVSNYCQQLTVDGGTLALSTSPVGRRSGRSPAGDHRNGRPAGGGSGAFVDVADVAGAGRGADVDRSGVPSGGGGHRNGRGCRPVGVGCRRRGVPAPTWPAVGVGWGRSPASPPGRRGWGAGRPADRGAVGVPSSLRCRRRPPYYIEGGKFPLASGVKGPLITSAMNNPPRKKTFTVEFTVTLNATGDDSFNHVPTSVEYFIDTDVDGLMAVDETEQTFTAFQNDVVVQWSTAFETTLPVGDAVEMIRRHVLIEWIGTNGCTGDHFESTGVDVTLNLDSIA